MNVTTLSARQRRRVARRRPGSGRLRAAGRRGQATTAAQVGLPGGIDGAAARDHPGGVRARPGAAGGAGRSRGGTGSPCGRCTAGTRRRRSPRCAPRPGTAGSRGRCSRPGGCSTGTGARPGRRPPAATAAPGCGTAPGRSGRAGSPTGTGRSSRAECTSATSRATISALPLSTRTTARRSDTTHSGSNVALSSRVRRTARTSLRGRQGGRRAAAYRSCSRHQRRYTTTSSGSGTAVGAVLGLEPEPQVVGVRDREERWSPPPPRPAHPGGLAQRGRPQRRVGHDGGHGPGAAPRYTTVGGGHGAEPYPGRLRTMLRRVSGCTERGRV